ncbi:efflux RND transporter permease subunit [Sphingosinicella soli]|uniref:Multidrug efflux pump n=1 Tax=Sphingosinicella soli TaxID=333708 RepID=A0A7W7B0B3_9SPHN|nr:efflux RND transporter permease subunit [Sphingosinicella soli]MBB4630615.1 multidrug efflux pump [Sphingosinicella soli]
MILSDVSVKRPVFAAVISLIIVLAGAIAFISLPVREYPAIEPPIVSVEVAYPGAAASVVESRITQLIEDRIAGVEGIEMIRSRSRDGVSDVTIEFSATRNVDDAANDIRDRVSGLADDLPDEVIPPEIRKVDVDSQPILWMHLSGEERDPLWLADYADRILVDRFSSIDGVARVQVSGLSRPAMRIWLDRARLAAYQLTPNDIETALRSQNVELPAGRVEAETQNLTVRVARAYSQVDDFRALVISRGDDGHLVRLGDVARVEVGPENPYSFFRSNGKPGVGIGIVRQSGANTLAVADEVKARLEETRKMLPAGLSIDISNDSSVFISAAIDNVWRTLAEASALVILVIYVFLGSARATIIPAVTVPICLIATFAVLWALGLSINLLTLLALVLAIGLVVDDAIVVLENIYYRIERGETPLVAAYEGARQVAFAVIATTAVVCAVFVPIMLLAGNTGLLFRELAAAMIGAVAFSGFIALTLTPMLCSKMLKSESSSNRLTRWVDERFDRVSAAYDRALGRLLNRPLLIGGISLAVVGGCIALATTLSSELAPLEDTGNLMVTATAAEGTGFDQMVQYMEDLQARVLPMVDEGPIRRMMVRAPGSWGTSEDFSSGRMVLFLKDWSERDQTTQETAEMVQKALEDYPGVRSFASGGQTIGSRGGRPIRFVIAGATFEELARARDAIMDAAASYPGIENLESDYKETKPQLLVDIDTTRAGDLGVSVADIGSTLETMMGSRRVTTYIDRGEEYRVIVQAEDKDRLTPQDLSNVYVRSRTGDVIPLSNLVSLRNFADAGELGHFNKLRAITLEGSVAPGYSLGEALDWLEAEASTLPEVAAIGYDGESRAFKQTGGAIWGVLAVTILLVFLVLAAQFESWVHPGIIVLTVPLAVGGGLLGLVVMGQSLNLYSQIGIVMLVGLASKNGILIVEFANQLRDQGVPFDDAIRGAAVRRLRPVIMTSIATVAGAVPLMLASGAGAASRQAIGTVVVWGVSLATLLTLFVIPVFYRRLARNTGSPLAVTRKLDEERGAEPAPAE